MKTNFFNKICTLFVVLGIFVLVSLSWPFATWANEKEIGYGYGYWYGYGSSPKIPVIPCDSRVSGVCENSENSLNSNSSVKIEENSNNNEILKNPSENNNLSINKENNSSENALNSDSEKENNSKNNLNSSSEKENSSVNNLENKTTENSKNSTNIIKTKDNFVNSEAENAKKTSWIKNYVSIIPKTGAWN